MMRIAQVMLAKGFGGAERTFVDMCRELARRGHEVLAIGECRGAALGMLAGSAGVDCAGIRCRGPWDRLAGHRIHRQLAAFRPHVVQAHLARAALLGGRAARSLAVPSVAKTHTLIDARDFRYVDVLVPTTGAQAAHLSAQGIAAERLFRIPNFSTLAPVAAVAARGGRPLTVKALGRFVHKKGFDLLIEAFAASVRSGLDARLVIAGDGPEGAALVAAAGRTGLAERIRIGAWVDDVGAFLDDADLFVLPSRVEPFGIVVLEAMARGVPIIATPTQGPSEILDAETAFVLPEISSTALAEALTRAARDPLATHARACAALDRFRACYAAEVVVGRYLDLYERMCSDQRFRAQP